MGNRTAILRSKKSYETGSTAAPISALGLDIRRTPRRGSRRPSNVAQIVCSGICREYHSYRVSDRKIAARCPDVPQFPCLTGNQEVPYLKATKRFHMSVWMTMLCFALWPMRAGTRPVARKVWATAPQFCGLKFYENGKPEPFRLPPWVRRSSDLDRGGPLARRANTDGQPLTRSGGAILRPQICGAVSKRGCNQIERRIIPNYYRLFNEFFPWVLRLNTRRGSALRSAN